MPVVTAELVLEALTAAIALIKDLILAGKDPLATFQQIRTGLQAEQDAADAAQKAIDAKFG